MRLRQLFEDGRIVKGVNTTVDVGPGEIKTQAAKFGNTVDRDGHPPTLSKKVKGKSTNVLYNLGLTEGYKLQLERDKELLVLHIKDTATGKRTEVRGKPGYESGNYDPNDKLHQLLDKVGKSANISELINGEVVTINPNHPDADRAKAATDKAYNEEFDNIKKIDLQNALDRMAEIAVNGDRLKDVFIMRNQHNMTFKQIGDEIGTKTDRARQVYLRSLRYLKKILQDYNVEENFADGKKKGKSRPGRVKRSGASCNGSVTALRKRAKNASGEKAKMYHWCANMKSGRKK